MKDISSGRSRKVLAGAFAGTLALSHAVDARAQGEARARAHASAGSRPDLTSAKRHYADAIAKFRAGEYADALSDFRLADEVKATPQAERYIGRCLDALGRPDEAREWYEKFLAHVPEKMAAQGDRTRARVAELRATPRKTSPEPGAARAAVAAESKPAPAVEDTSTSSHTAAAEAEVVPIQPDVSAAQPLTPEPPPPTPEPHSSPTLAYLAGGAALAAAGVGATFGVLALNDRSAFDKNPTEPNAATRNQHALIADVAFGVAAATGVASLVLFLTHRDPHPDPPAEPDGAASGPSRVAGRSRASAGVTVSPSAFVGPHGGGAGFVLRY